ncbi:unnamed protein product [Paramecium octaurelia]|uniref:Uncharacterized protein n=1 Tax=Paramecium octaurelia TaxID=43137 RepID=A0A8S1XMA6_PAROT|nr:unnamed protein product [Paramecium octaurelia]
MIQIVLLQNVQSYNELNQIHPFLHSLEKESKVCSSTYCEIIKSFFALLVKYKNSLSTQMIHKNYYNFSYSINDLNFIMSIGVLHYCLKVQNSKEINNSLLAVIFEHLGDKIVSQIQLYSLLTNLIADDFDNVLKSEILKKVHPQFEQGFYSAEYINELMYCISTAFYTINENQIQELTNIRLSDYLIYPNLLDIIICFLKVAKKKNHVYSLKKRITDDSRLLERCNQIKEMSLKDDIEYEEFLKSLTKID